MTQIGSTAFDDVRIAFADTHRVTTGEIHDVLIAFKTVGIGTMGLWQAVKEALEALDAAFLHEFPIQDGMRDTVHCRDQMPAVFSRLKNIQFIEFDCIGDLRLWWCGRQAAA